ncbi:uncharacterized protein LOC132705625 [Cylas formicarius]|uniref:uncharacterized protein LOC132705625 n=1 Tax=Cylas formicarius TaxID=197179 RepID=UPI002958830A|nr:uncharacterized protein LOC132705625 [Cylas formicarius]
MMMMKKGLKIGNNYEEDNFVRREKRRRLEISVDVAKMRSNLPSYDLNDIRKHRLPYHEALILELQQNNYVLTEMYLKQLFGLQEVSRKEAGPQSLAWTFPVLRDSVAELVKLIDGLKKSEEHHRRGNFLEETDTLLQVAVGFAFDGDEWWWIAEQLFLQCISNCTHYGNLMKLEAMSRYAYSKMLIEKARDYENAEEQLERTCEISSGKTWNASKIFRDINEPIFMSCNYLLHICLIKQAHQWSKTHARQAIEFASLARKRANEACYYDGETDALLLKGQCELDILDTKSAISSFKKAYHIQSRLGSQKGMCQVRVELSKAYLMSDNIKLALENLSVLKEVAEKHNLKLYLAQAYRHLGEFYLKNGDPREATPLLMDSLQIFHESGDMATADEIRIFVALSAGLNLMPAYVNLVIRSGRCFSHSAKLIDWKDSRKPFWDVKLSDPLLNGSIFQQKKSSVEYVSHTELIGEKENEEPQNESLIGTTQYLYAP